jgi:tetratricopeptide (TPR) repeat protein
MGEELEPLAGTTASLVASTALSATDQPAELAAWPGLARLVALLHQTATGDLALRAALAAVSAAPEDPDWVVALAHALDAHARRDSGLRAELEHLLDQAEQHPTAGALVTQIAGHARVGKLVTIGRAGQVHVHLPPAPPQTVLDQLPPARAGPLVANLPPRNPNFTGRAHLLDHLHQRLHTGQPAAVVQVQAQTLHGLGGVGKTQLALEYAYRRAHDYDLIWWVTAEPAAAIPGQLVALARRLGLPEQPEQAETVQALWDALRQRDRWLLVLDNAEDPADLRPWWPPGSGHVLVTSRNPTWAGPASTLAVDVLPRTEAVAFLEHRLGRHDPSLNQLAAALGDLPLALEQAAAYLEQTHTSSGLYLEMLATRARELFALGRSVTSQQTIATIWSLSLHRLHAEAPAAEDLLRLCAFLAPDDIPRRLLEDHPDALPEPLAAAVRDRLGYQQALGGLGRYSLAAVTESAVSVHRLVEAVVRHALAPEQVRQWAATAVRLVLAAFPQAAEDVGTWPTAAPLLPHAMAATDHAEMVGADPAATAALLHGAGRYLWSRAEYAQARALHRRALAIREARLGIDHPDTASSLVSLGVVLRDQGVLDQARSLLERGLSIYEARLGPDHPDTARSLHFLALVLRSQGDLDRARPLYERALAIREAHLGPNHLHVAQTLSNLGTLMYMQGDLDAARSLHERALAIRQARLGADHPTTANSVAILALVLHDQGDLAAARSLHERALRIRETRLGANHDLTAYSLGNLAAVLYDQGDLAAARSLHERALAIRQTRLGGDHPTTADSLTNLAEVLAAQGDLAAARSLLERALAIHETRLGADHPDTARSLHELARVLRDQGDLQGTRTRFERALAIREQRLGADHPDTVRSRRDLAAVVAALDERQ